VLEAPRDAIHTEAFNVKRLEELPCMRELAEIIRDTMPGFEFESAGDASPDTRNNRVDCSKIARALPSLVPQRTAPKGAAQLYEAYRDHGISLQERGGYRYRRICQTKRRLSAGDLDGELRGKPA
jgi:hypothetical protein